MHRQGWHNDLTETETGEYEMRGGTHYGEAADALVGAYSLTAGGQLYKCVEVETISNYGGQGGVYRGWSDVFCGWVVDGDDDVSVFATESEARAWAAGTWYPDHK